MKPYFTLALFAFACIILSCGKGGSPSPTGTGTGTGIKTGTDTVTVNNKPEYIFRLAPNNQLILDTALNFVQTSFLVINADFTATRGVYLKSGGKIKGELKNLDSGKLDYEGGQYSKFYYPKNVYLDNGPDHLPVAKDTATYVCLKLTDPTLKDTKTGQPVIVFFFLLKSSGNVGSGSLDVETDVKTGLMNGKQLTALFSRSDYKLTSGSL